MTRPLIGVTVSRRSGWRIFPLVAANVWLAGGRAVRWQGVEAVDVGAVDGVIVGGGDDISPTLYGGEIRAEVRLDRRRDAMERDILRAALADGAPVLGICRGAQMLNVVLGGTLHQDAYAAFPSRYVRTILPRKTLRIAPGARLARICGEEPMKVNALHTQSVDRLGEGLRVAARDDGDMIQAIERPGDPFALGVQWHPEHLIYARRQRRIFRALVEAGAAFAERRGARAPHRAGAV